MQHIDPETAIIGAGQAGMPLARALSAAGRPLVLFEREHPGGSCVNFGCTPSKAMIASARLAADIKHGGTLGIRATGIKIDFAAVIDRARRLANEGADEDRSDVVPYAMFTSPELGRIGLDDGGTKDQRACQGWPRPMTQSGKAREIGKTDGFIKVIIDAEAETILGATALCEQGSEIIQLFAKLMLSGGKASDIRRAIHIHQTLAQAAKNTILSALR